MTVSLSCGSSLLTRVLDADQRKLHDPQDYLGAEKNVRAPIAIVGKRANLIPSVKTTTSEKGSLGDTP